MAEKNVLPDFLSRTNYSTTHTTADDEINSFPDPPISTWAPHAAKPIPEPVPLTVELSEASTQTHLFTQEQNAKTSAQPAITQTPDMPNANALSPHITSVQNGPRPKFQLQYKEADLFTAPENVSLAHCVAEDMRMGAGIVTQFVAKFGKIAYLKKTMQIDRASGSPPPGE